MQHTFTIAQKDIFDLLISMQPICNKRTALDVTETIFFFIAPRELTLKATDLEISLQSTVPIEASSIDNVGFLVSGKRIFDLMKEMEGDIQFTITDRQLQVKSGGVDLVLHIRDPQEFPQFPERIENLLQCDAKFLLELLNKVAFLVPQNNVNQALNGMLLEFSNNQLHMVATDGHCLAKVSTPRYSLDEDRKWLLPKRAVLELKKILEVTQDETIFLGVCGNQLVFSGEHFNFFTKLLVDTFPHYESIMEKEGFIPARISKNHFVKSLKRAGCLLAGQFISTSFSFKPGNLDIKLHNQGIGTLEESVTLEAFQGDAIEGRFYSPYLLNGLQVFSDSDVSFQIKNEKKPIIFESKRDDYHFVYLVMPVSAKQ